MPCRPWPATVWTEPGQWSPVLRTCTHCRGRRHFPLRHRCCQRQRVCVIPGPARCQRCRMPAPASQQCARVDRQPRCPHQGRCDCLRPTTSLLQSCRARLPYQPHDRDQVHRRLCASSALPWLALAGITPCTLLSGGHHQPPRLLPGLQPCPALGVPLAKALHRAAPVTFGQAQLAAPAQAFYCSACYRTHPAQPAWQSTQVDQNFTNPPRHLVPLGLGAVVHSFNPQDFHTPCGQLDQPSHSAQ